MNEIVKSAYAAFSKQVSFKEIKDFMLKHGYVVEERIVSEKEDAVNDPELTFWEIKNRGHYDILKVNDAGVYSVYDKKFIEPLTSDWTALLTSKFKKVYTDYVSRLVHVGEGNFIEKNEYIGMIDQNDIIKFLKKEGFEVTNLTHTEKDYSIYFAKTNKGGLWLNSFDIYSDKTILTVEPLRAHWLKYVTALMTKKGVCFAKLYTADTMAYFEKQIKEQLQAKQSSYTEKTDEIANKKINKVKDSITNIEK